jgi:polysaccharide biosynthesis transport protein
MAEPAEHVDPEAADPSQWQRSIDWFGMAWRRKSLLALGVVVGLVMGGIVYFQRTPIYQSKSQVMVIKKAGSPMPAAGADPRMTFYEDYVATHLVVVKSPLIVQRAVQKFNLAGLPSFQGQGDPTGTILLNIVTTRDTTASTANNIINLSYRGTVPQDTARVLQAVITSYKEFLDETYKNVSDDTLKQISRAAADLQKTLDEKEKAYSKFRQKSPLVYWRGNEGGSMQEDWLVQIQSKRLGLTMRRAELQGRLTSMEKAIKEGRGRQVLQAQLATASALASTGATGGGPGGIERQLDQQLLELQLKEQALLADFGPDHPEVVAVRKRMALTRDFFTHGADKDKERGKGMQATDTVKWYVDSLRQEQEDVEVSLKSLTALATAEQQEARETARFKEEDKRHRDDITRTQQAFEPIIKQMEQIKAVRELGGFDAQVIAPGRDGIKVAPVALQVFLLSGVLGLMGGLGLAYLAEVTDKSFRTPEEIRRRLGLAVVGHIPALVPDTEAAEEAKASGIFLDPILCSYYKAQSVQAEAFRGVRTALYFSTQGEGHKVIQVTSPNPSDGKSTVTANLAISIAQSGKKILLIDADFRKPRQQKLFGVFAATGMASVIAGQTELKDAIHATEVPGLSLLPCGPRPDNPAELLTSPQFKELIERVRGDFDYVLIDTPPLLAVSDPSVVAPRVDGVILTIRVMKNARSGAERAKEILATLGARVLGVVVNGIGGGSRGGYGYGGSGYGYGYAYQYQYQYEDSYLDSAEESAAADSPPETNGASARQLLEGSEDAIGQMPEPEKEARPGTSSFVRRRVRQPAEPKNGGLLGKFVSWWRSS